MKKGYKRRKDKRRGREGSCGIDEGGKKVNDKEMKENI